MFAIMFNNADPVPLGLTKMLDGEMTATGPPETTGSMDPVRETVPVKLPMLESVTLTNPTEP